MINVETINLWSEAKARAAFVSCCGATRWAEGMSARRPFASAQHLLDAARQVWQTLGRADWLEAFAAHPKIGDLDSLRTKFATTAAWAAREQAGVEGAGETTLLALAEGNRQYEARFGHIFIVCASGKSAEEMLTLLQARLRNDPEEELRIAAGEQQKITRLRLDRLAP
jgi:2-oxo-4-hydroxy-4-carboxy-5-ureidoimidazoline decarboxylase